MKEGLSFIRESVPFLTKSLLEETNDTLALKQFKIEPERLSNLASIFHGVVSPNTLKIAHERFFPLQSFPNSDRKLEDLKIFRENQNQAHFRFFNYTPYVGAVASLGSAFYVSNHFSRHLKLGMGRIPVFIFSVALTGALSCVILERFGYSYLARFGLPDCLTCHSAKAALLVAFTSSVYPTLASACLGVHFGQMSDRRVVPLDIYTSKTTLFEALSLVSKMGLRNYFLPKLGVVSSLIGVGTYFAMEQEYLEFIKLFSLVCHSIDNPQAFSFRRAKLDVSTPK